MLPCAGEKRYSEYVTYVEYVALSRTKGGDVSATAATPVDYPSFTRARTHLKDVLDASSNGRIVTIARDGKVNAVVAADRLRDYFFRTVPPRVRVASEEGRVITLMEGRPFVSEGSDVEAALADLVVSLREYAEDWELRLQHAPNHADAWALVQLVRLSSDAELLDWFDRGDE